MKITVHAGHNPDGMIACGAVGFLRESTCARQIVTHMMRYDLKDSQLVDVTVNNGTSQKDVLNRLKQKINAENPALSISVHLNAASSASAAGVEAYYYSTNERMHNLCDLICKDLARLGYKNRGSKIGDGLAIINGVKPDSILIECGFVSNEDDCQRFDAAKIAQSILYSLAVHTGSIASTEINTDEKNLYRVQVGAYTSLDNARHMQKLLKEAMNMESIVVRG